MNRLEVNVLAAFALCVLAVTLAVLVLPPSLSWAAGGGGAQKQVQEGRIYSPNCVEGGFSDVRLQDPA
jgi:hypothetical protein